jgi:hypothetical protein
MTAGGYDAASLPAGVRSRMVESVTGLNMHVLEAGFEVENRPCVVLLHGFPELDSPGGCPRQDAISCRSRRENQPHAR